MSTCANTVRPPPSLPSAVSSHLGAKQVFPRHSGAKTESRLKRCANQSAQSELPTKVGVTRAAFSKNNYARVKHENTAIYCTHENTVLTHTRAIKHKAISAALLPFRGRYFLSRAVTTVSGLVKP